jgi:hypothetical protein
VAILVLYVLHQDFWFWRSAHPLVFGVLPVGLAYHVAYMLVTSTTLAWIVRSAWPSHLARDDEDPRR